MHRWRDRLIYGAVWLACLYPAASLAWRLYANDLGANPVEELLRSLGEWALRFLLVSLALTPAAQILKRPVFIRYRRTVGLWAFTYVCLHLLTYVVVDHWFDWPTIAADIVKRPYITLGMTAFVLLIPLAITSTNAMMRKLGPRRWRKLHRLIYPIAVLGVIHFYLLVKADTTRPVIYGAILTALLGYRAVRWATTRKPRRAPKPRTAEA